VQVSVDSDTTCALRSTGQVFCWGSNIFGQLGNGTTYDRAAPSLVHDLDDATAISIGHDTVCALRVGGRVAYWGNRDAVATGSIGSLTGEGQPTPVPVVHLTDAIAISVGYSHACAIRADHSVVCWGQEFPGDNQALAPVTIPHLANVRAISLGEDHSCALVASGRAFCWGQNEHGELGDGTHTMSWEPVALHGLQHLVAISASRQHTCALRNDGRVFCVGLIDEIHLVTSPTHDPRFPTAIAGVTDAVALTSTCAIRKDHTAVCWGDNTAGQLGNGTTTDSLQRAVAVKGLAGVLSISASGVNACAIRTLRPTLVCWGARARPLGRGIRDSYGITNSSTPIPVAHF
jgi:alpha-tubulin suppressor-like RCC1 family protein